jgi:hypothetical protein
MGGPHPRPLPSPLAPLPLHCGRGGIGFVNAASLQDAGARSPLLRSRSAGSKGGWGKVWGVPSPLAPLPRCGRGGIGFVNAASLQDAGAGSPLLRSRSAGSKGGWGKVRGHDPPVRSSWGSGRRQGQRYGGVIPPFLSRSAGEEGGWGEGEGRRACSAAQAPKPDIAHHYQILSKAQVFDHAHKSAIIVRV